MLLLRVRLALPEIGAIELDKPLSHRREEKSAVDDAISVHFDRDV
jgi:hypothetical protein